MIQMNVIFLNLLTDVSSPAIRFPQCSFTIIPGFNLSKQIFVRYANSPNDPLRHLKYPLDICRAEKNNIAFSKVQNI